MYYYIVMAFTRILDRFSTMVYDSPLLFRLLQKYWYAWVSRIDKKGEVRFLNYGYSSLSDPHIELRPQDEADRYSLQLYEHVANPAGLKNKDVLEVGCGHGGGAAYIASYLKPKNIVASDINKTAIKFNAKYYKDIPNLRFVVADAHKLPFPDESFDAVINIESSHHYEDFTRFMREVRRILRPGGYLLMACYRKKEKMLNVEEDVRVSGMTIETAEDIVENVVRALDADSKRRLALVQKLAPNISRSVAVDFAGVKGSALYDSFANRDKSYMNYIIRK